MEVDNQTNPSHINSLLSGSLKIVDLNKKRKLEAEQLGLPVSKHQCWKQILPPKPPTFVSIVDGALSTCTTEVKGSDIYDASETGSDKDSNSFPRNSNSMSSHAEAKFGTVYSNYLPYDKALTSSSNRGSISQGSRCSSSSSRSVEKAIFSPGEETEAADVELDENIEESLVEYGSHMDYICSEYGNYSIQQYQDKEIEELLEPNEAHPNDYVLSSGRWSVNQEAPPTTRKPTIDQEFEQYFSMLML
ncbi:protein FAR-RED-ELONGATED HYPOCOTYL 1-LIKE-like [Hibiscus syriacus]|uniref:protein FAR-RED-ELONGATED HYPOCOTYL 1-LIKE-like n=1 Tax=Hibiscus syriacus TaxID=106335 RepID=UPI001922F283|nr:protein FAR-RED-ELONGATED HYPOCOTYL 1-LIKE-like [Hibiscus syriacus]